MPRHLQWRLRRQTYRAAKDRLSPAKTLTWPCSTLSRGLRRDPLLVRGQLLRLYGDELGVISGSGKGRIRGSQLSGFQFRMSVYEEICALRRLPFSCPENLFFAFPASIESDRFEETMRRTFLLSVCLLAAVFLDRAAPAGIASPRPLPVSLCAETVPKITLPGWRPSTCGGCNRRRKLLRLSANIDTNKRPSSRAAGRDADSRSKFGDKNMIR